MKNFIALIFLLLITISGYTQDSTIVINDTTVENTFTLDDNFPQIFKVNGEVIGVLFTVEQAQKIDNDYEMYSLMDSIIKQYGLNDSITVGIIDAQGKKIASMDLQIDNLNSMLANKDVMINTKNDIIEELKYKIDLYDAEILLYKQKEDSYEEEKKALEKGNKETKTSENTSFVGAGTAAVGVIVLGVLVAK